MREEKLPVNASDIRTKYALVFKLIDEYYNLIYREKLGDKFEDAQKTTEILKENDQISEYIYESLRKLFELYPTMLPGKVAQNLSEDSDKEEKRQDQLDDLLNIMINDLNDLITDKAEVIAERQILDQDGFDD